MHRVSQCNINIQIKMYEIFINERVKKIYIKGFFVTGLQL